MWGAEGARDRALVRGLETLRQKDYRRWESLERPQHEVTKGVSPEIAIGQSLR
jgi:hypothetical protein